MSSDGRIFFTLPPSDVGSEETETENMFSVSAQKPLSQSGRDQFQFSMSSDDDEEDGEEGELHSHLFAACDFNTRDAFAEESDLTNTADGQCGPESDEHGYRLASRSSILKTLSSSLPRVLTNNKPKPSVCKTKSTGHMAAALGTDLQETKNKNKESRPKRPAPKPLPPPPPPLPPTSEAKRESTGTFFPMFPDLCAAQSDRRKQYSAAVQNFLRETQDYQLHTVDKRLRKEVGNLLQTLFVVRDHVEGRESPPPSTSVSLSQMQSEECARSGTENGTNFKLQEGTSGTDNVGSRVDKTVTKYSSNERKDKKARARGRERSKKQEREKERSRKEKKASGADVDCRPSSLPTPVSPIQMLNDFVTRSAPLSPRTLHSPRSPRSRSPRRAVRFKTRSNSDRNVFGETGASANLLHRSGGTSREKPVASVRADEEGGTKNSEERFSRRNSRDRSRREKYDVALDEHGDAEPERLVKVSERDWQIFCRFLRPV